MVAEPGDGDVAGDVEAELRARGVDAVGDRVREAEDGGRPVGLAQQLERERARAVQRVGRRDDLAVEPQGARGLARRRARPAGRARSRPPTTARSRAGARGRRGGAACPRRRAGCRRRPRRRRATPVSASPIVTVGICSAIAAQPPLPGPIGTTTRPSTRWSTSRWASSSSRAGSPSASATSVLRSAVCSSRWTARTSSWFQKSARLPTSSPTTPVSPPASARAIGSASYPSSSAAARTRSSVSVDTCIPRSA